MRSRWWRLIVTIALASPMLVSSGASQEVLDGGLTVAPGDQASSAGCTLAFVLDGQGARAGDVFFLIAHHCTREVGQQVTVSTYGPIGAVVHRADRDLGTRTHDYALIQVYDHVEPDVDPAVRGHPGWPTGVTTATETQTGDLAQHSGWGLGFTFLGPTREQRVAVHLADTEAEYQHLGSATFGDSGGPVVHVPSGKALGIVSGLNGADCCAASGALWVGPTVEGILTKLGEAGYDLELRTAG